jgi:hypothetical protein
VYQGLIFLPVGVKYRFCSCHLPFFDDYLSQSFQLLSLLCGDTNTLLAIKVYFLVGFAKGHKLTVITIFPRTLPNV